MSEETAIVALIPAGESGEVHSTLVYFSVDVLPAMTQIAASLARFWPAPGGVVVAHDRFGSTAEELVDVAVLQGPTLQVLNDAVKQYSISEWGYAPHITKQPGYQLPPVGAWVSFDRIALWNDGIGRMCWRFGSGERCAP